MTGNHNSSLIDTLGENTIIDPSVEILVENKQNDGRGIFIGSNCIIYPRNRLVLGDMRANPDANMFIGDHVHINAGGYFSGEGDLVINDYVLIGPNVCILSAGHKYTDPCHPIQTQGLTYGHILIKRDVWIGGGAVILQDVTIGEGAVIGAGAVVSSDVPPRAVVVGNPSRIIKYRGTFHKRHGHAVFLLVFKIAKNMLKGTKFLSNKLLAVLNRRFFGFE